MQSEQLTQFYEHVQSAGKLRTPMHAQRWTRGVLQQLGLNLPKGAKKELSNALPEELAAGLNGVFWLFNFRNTNISSLEFQTRVARRSGNSDKAFARYPVEAVFGGLKLFTNSSIEQSIADGLSPELRAIWESHSA